MTSGYCVRTIMRDSLRIQLDDYGFEDVSFEHDDKYSWVLSRGDQPVGRAYYTMDHIIIEIKP